MTDIDIEKLKQAVKANKVMWLAADYQARIIRRIGPPPAEEIPESFCSSRAQLFQKPIYEN